MGAREDLQEQAGRLRESGALGRSVPIAQLFDYLLERSLAGEAPKEIEVAQAVFGRAGGFDISQDSTVRVYVHRLRKKLDDFYAGSGRDEPVQITIPKGEYRLVPVAREVVEAIESHAGAGWLKPWMAAALAALLVLNLAGLAVWWASSHNSYGAVRGSPAWRVLVEDERPIIVVVGDYYIFGEMDSHQEVARLVREYSVNSPEELADFVMAKPEYANRYANLDLYYLPVSIAPAMSKLMPVLSPTPRARERVRVITASQLTPDMLKRNDIVYVGYFSGMGLLKDTVFQGSRFRVGETFDEIIDVTNQKRYLSQEGGPEFDGETRKDYGYFATFEGLEGNRFMIIAGTRDVAVMNTAEAVTSREGLAAIKAKAGKDTGFEALYEVQGVNRVNLRGALIVTSRLRPGMSYGPAPRFPSN